MNNETEGLDKIQSYFLFNVLERISNLLVYGREEGLTRAKVVVTGKERRRAKVRGGLLISSQMFQRRVFPGGNLPRTYPTLKHLGQHQ